MRSRLSLGSAIPDMPPASLAAPAVHLPLLSPELHGSAVSVMAGGRSSGAVSAGPSQHSVAAHHTLVLPYNLQLATPGENRCCESGVLHDAHISSLD